MREARELLGLPLNEKLVLNVSQGTSNKNYSMLAQIATHLRADYRMVKVGAKLQNAPSAVHLENLSHDVYPYLFNACDVYVHASSQEGFGWPLIEAAASELPVVALRTDVATEVLSDAAQFVGPHDSIDRWIAAIERLANADVRHQTILRSKARLPLFNPQTALNLYETLYRRAFDR
ncbi:MAG TPA: glycosyltransferase [Thermoplasmata archaeon]|nr:glycosyltransferase [Thermoplasmata archaeon]